MNCYAILMLLSLLNNSINICTQYENTIFIFVHGIFDTSKQSEQYEKILPGAVVVSFDFADAMHIPFLYRPFCSSLGQDDEIEKLNDIYKSIITRFEKKPSPVPPIVLIGISRGASVILNFLATKKPQYVIAAICESPFDSIKNVAKNASIRYFPKNMQAHGEKLLFSLFPYHNPQGICPLSCIDKIDSNLPILFIASQQDIRVPIESTENVFKIMNNEGKNVYFKSFKRGKHAKILKNNKDEYKKTVDSFLQNYLL